MEWGRILLACILAIVVLLPVKVIVALAFMQLAGVRHRELRRRPWRLMLPQFERTARRLRALGFTEIGARVEWTPALSVPSRVFYSRADRTYATLYSFLLIPKVSFTTLFDSGALHFSGESDADRKSDSRRPGRKDQGRVERRLEGHRAGVKARTLRGEVPCGEGTMAESIALARRFYSTLA